MRMAPEMAQFESKFKDKIQIVDISLDKQNDPNLKKHEQLVRQISSIPYTVWLNKEGKTIDQTLGYATMAELEQKTNALLK